MKTPITKKKIIISGLTGLCLLVLAGAYFLTREPETEFIPAAVDAVPAATASWDENTELDMSGSLKDTTKDNQVSGSPTDDTQVIVSEDASGSTSNLTNSKTKEDSSVEKPSEKPVPPEDTTNPNTPPSYEPPASQENPEDTSAPPADSGAHDGEIYDPVFGWLPVGGETQQDIIDSGGDINKQIGTMGG